jgi:hypothetical protein
MESGNRLAQTPWRWLRAFASGIVVGVKKMKRPRVVRRLPNSA